MTNTVTKRTHTIGNVTWETTNERIVATYAPLTDEKCRIVHGYAVLTETPADMLGRTLTTQWGTTVAFGDKAFRVRIFATRNGENFGANPSATVYATRAEAVAHAHKALTAQGVRYAKKYAKKA
jgi:hypothetical protein